jgi:hypothetical protein
MRSTRLLPNDGPPISIPKKLLLFLNMFAKVALGLRTKSRAVRKWEHFISPPPSSLSPYPSCVPFTNRGYFLLKPILKHLCIVGSTTLIQISKTTCWLRATRIIENTIHWISAMFHNYIFTSYSYHREHDAQCSWNFNSCIVILNNHYHVSTSHTNIIVY